VADAVQVAAGWSWADPEQVRGVAQAAMRAWGLAGVGVRRGDTWQAAALIAPPPGLPAGHPLALGGLDPALAGLVWLHLAPGLPRLGVGQRLCAGLGRRLRGQVAGLEAQTGPAGLALGPGLPSREWLVMMGFRPVRYPAGRYRLDFQAMVGWTWPAWGWRPRPVIGLGAQPAPANRSWRAG
jgi:hypothetical protein